MSETEAKFNCNVCRDFGWRWTGKIKGGDCAGQWHGWYICADDPDRRPSNFNIKRPCHCGQPERPE